MSKVYSFRLDENNPREAQAKEVIDAWVEEGYSLRRIIVDATIQYKKNGNQDVDFLVKQVNVLVKKLMDRQTPEFVDKKGKGDLSNNFINSVTQSLKLGMKRE
jgi:hypothetical protein